MPSLFRARSGESGARDFRLLWAGQTASHLGAQLSLVVLPLIAVLALDAGSTELGLLRAVEQAPILLFSLFVGAWVDRWRTRRVMVLADLGRALAMAAVPVAYLLGVLGYPALLVVAFFVGVLGVVFDVAYQAFLVRLVPRDRLVRSNSALEGSKSAARIGGPALGGALASLVSAPLAVLTGAFCFALSALSIRRIRRCEPRSADSVRPTGIWLQIHEGLRLVAGSAALRAVAVASAVFQFSFAALMTMYLLFLARGLHLPGAAIGLVLAATGPGALLGSLLAARLPGALGYGRVLVGAALLADGVLLCVPALHGSGAATVALLMAVNFTFGISSQIVDVTVTAVRQALTPVHVQGRVVATLNFLGMGLTPVGSLLGGLLAGACGTRGALLLAGCCLALSPLTLALSPLAGLKELPREPRR